MSQLGCITLPSDILHKVHAGLPLDDEEWQTYKKHPATGSRMISQIPRLEKVSGIIGHQLTKYEDFGEDIEEDVVAKNGTLLIPKDRKITWSIIGSLTNFVKHVGIEEPPRVRAIVR